MTIAGIRDIAAPIDGALPTEKAIGVHAATAGARKAITAIAAIGVTTAGVRTTAIGARAAPAIGTIDLIVQSRSGLLKPGT